MLTNPSTEGDSLTPGQEPVIAPGVRGVWFDTPRGIYIPIIIAETPGNGDVGRMLEKLPRDRRVVFPCVISQTLESMLERRGYLFGVELHNGEPVEIWQRGAIEPIARLEQAAERKSA